MQMKSNNAGWLRPATLELSTVELPFCTNDFPYESCLFSGTDSEILERYKTLQEAIEGHIK